LQRCHSREGLLSQRRAAVRRRRPQPLEEVVSPETVGTCSLIQDMHTRTYRPSVWYPLVVLTIGSVALWGLGVTVRYPNVFTPKGLFIFLLFGGTEVLTICTGIRILRASWRFTITPDSLIAERKLFRDRV